MLRQRIDRGTTIVVAGFDDLHQRRPTQRLHAEKAGTERRAFLALHCFRIVIPEHERARDRPFAGLGRGFEHEGVRRIEADGAQ
jgi:hypothetical protein